MVGIFEKIFSSKQPYGEEFTDEDYVHIDATSVPKESRGKVIVRPFVIEDFSDIKPALDALREGYTIALLNIKPLRDKDLVELKRAVAKVRKICEAVNGDIAGFGEDWIVVTPSFASVFRGQTVPPETVQQ